MEPIFVLQAVNALLLVPIYFILLYVLKELREVRKCCMDQNRAIGVLEGRLEGDKP